jgi:hypothetical protein
MKSLAIAVVLLGTLADGLISAQGASTLGTVQLARTVLANGHPLAPGTYEVRTTNEQPPPAVGESPAGERWIEFVKNGSVAGREVAVIVSASDISDIAKGAVPKANGQRVDVLKGGEYLRVWINRESTNYIINMPLVR